MGWPWRHDNWRDAAEPARKAFTAVAQAIARFEPVNVGARTEDVGLMLSCDPSDLKVPFRVLEQYFSCAGVICLAVPRP